MLPTAQPAFDEVADERMADASTLRERGRHHAAVYLLGYAVECRLKAVLQRKSRRFPSSGPEGHHLRGLWDAAGFDRERIAARRQSEAAMTHSDLSGRIRSNMREGRLSLEDLRVQPDPPNRWRVAVVSPDFAGMSLPERRARVLLGLDDELFQWVDLLTPEEREWAGVLPRDGELDDIPMWPEVLERAESTDPIVFPSDLDEDLPRPIVATFYSLRGGVGRSTALAYTARLLARERRSVLCLDEARS